MGLFIFFFIICPIVYVLLIVYLIKLTIDFFYELLKGRC